MPQRMGVSLEIPEDYLAESAHGKGLECFGVQEQHALGSSSEVRLDLPGDVREKRYQPRLV